MHSRAISCLCVTLVSVALAASAAAATPKSNAEMKAIFDADQAERADSNSFINNMAKVQANDAARRAKTRQLLDSGLLETGDDFSEAAFVFQHGDKPADWLLAHTLAMVAVAKGRSDALWIASATLDRYLQKIGQPQIFGTQYNSSWPYEGGLPQQSKATTTQDPYDRTLVPDALRRELTVPTLKEQETRRAEIERDMRAQRPLEPSVSGPAVHN